VALSPEQIVNGKYRIVRLLGDGGMGSVYEAHHEVLGTRVALKLLHPEFSRTGVAKRFLQEARASARIKSRHVVTVSDADQTPDGQAFIVLEYLEGKTLRQRYEELAREGQTLARDEALDLAMQIFEGVEAAHAAGIVHRDLKPDNLMIAQDSKGAPLLKILDFGIAKVDETPQSSVDRRPPGSAKVGSAKPALTRPGALLGTPEYMAPEQVYSAGSADVRSDVFSLGVILFEMLAGRRPILSDDPQQIAVSYLTGAYSRLDEAVPDIAPGLAVAVHRALAAQPRDRFPTVAEMRAAFEPYAPAHPSTNRASIVVPMSSGQPRPIPETRKYPASQPSPSGASSASVVSSGSSRGPLLPPSGMGEPVAATPAGTHIMPASGKAGTQLVAAVAPAPSPAFQPDYPAAIAPFSTPPAGPTPPPRSSIPSDGGPSIVHPSSRLPYGYGPPPPIVPPPKGKSKKGMWAAIAASALVLVASITVGSLYYLGWLDSEPEHKEQPHKRTPKQKAAPAPAPPPPHEPRQLR
jgi:serine/threonine-protein kinase